MLFHGAKAEIDGEIDLHHGRQNNDFGQGFYTGESYEQAISFASGFDNSSVYYLNFNDKNLKSKRYEVNQEWMMTIAYYRGTLVEYKNHPKIKALVEASRDCDYIIAPIADNRMFQIINSFIAGGLDISIKNKATYELMSKEEAKAVEKQIKATVKVQNTSKDVKKGKTTKVAFDKKMNMNNVKSITYSTENKKVATVSKSGKVTAKAKGTVKVKATVILKNGSKKTVTMKIKVK